MLGEVRFVYIKKEANEHLENNRIHGVGGNGKFFWKEVAKTKDEKVENCSKINQKCSRLVVGE